jgi:hypothetical protein
MMGLFAEYIKGGTASFRGCPKYPSNKSPMVRAIRDSLETGSPYDSLKHLLPSPLLPNVLTVSVRRTVTQR